MSKQTKHILLTHQILIRKIRLIQQIENAQKVKYAMHLICFGVFNQNVYGSTKIKNAQNSVKRQNTQTNSDSVLITTINLKAMPKTVILLTYIYIYIYIRTTLDGGLCVCCFKLITIYKPFGVKDHVHLI